MISQNIWLTIIGVLVGLPAGVGVLQWLLTALAGEYELKLMLGPLTYGVSILLTFGVSLLVSLMVARKNRKIDMVEALKGAEYPLCKPIKRILNTHSEQDIVPARFFCIDVIPCLQVL